MDKGGGTTDLQNSKQVVPTRAPMEEPKEDGNATTCQIREIMDVFTQSYLGILRFRLFM